MKMEKILSALGSQTRREILKLIAKEPKSVKEVLEGLSRTGQKLRYRESVYKALEDLVDSDLVEKFYLRNRGICYKLVVRKITLDLVEGTVVVVE